MVRVMRAVILLALAAVLVRAGMAELWTLVRASGPAASGALVAGVRAEVRIVRDRYAHVHVAAQSESDALFGLGLAHAQDRFWQMDLLRRTARGRTAELFGPAAVARDRVARTLGFGAAADREARRIETPTARLLTAYSAGVNTWLAEMRAGRAPVPGELSWLDAPIEDWSPADTLALLRLRSWALSRSLSASLLLDRLVRERGTTASHLLFPAAPPGVQAGGAASLSPLVHAFEDLRGSIGLEGAGVGSSGVLVGANRSRTGRPLLANDPHVEFQVPSRFYVAQIDAPGLSIGGATWPGIPVFWLGTNHRIAWGQVALQTVVSDLFDEALDPRNPDRYHVDGRWHDTERESQSIAVRNREPVEIEVVHTRHGPLVASILPDNPDVRSYSIRWTGSERRSGIAALLELQRAQNWSGFREALREFPVPPTTFLYADTDGAIGTQVAGRLPQRPIDTNLLPVPGEYGWTGFVGFDALPSRHGTDIDWIAVSRRGDGHVFDPRTEWLWSEGGAVERVRERLGEAEKLDLAELMEIQGERHSAAGVRQVRALVEPVEAETRGGRRVREILLSWNGSTEAGSPGAAAYHVFRQELSRGMLAARFSGDAEPLGALIAEAEPMPGVLLERFLDRAAGAAEGERVRAALEDTWEWLATNRSSNPRRWLWGELRQVRFPHAFEREGDGALTWIGRWLGLGSLALPGDPDSPWTVYHGSLREPAPAVGPALRYAVDLADVYHSRISMAGGQSGYPGSARYRDGIDDWLAQRPRFLWTHPSDYDDRSSGVWTLTPAPPPVPARRPSVPPRVEGP